MEFLEGVVFLGLWLILWKWNYTKLTSISPGSYTHIICPWETYNIKNGEWTGGRGKEKEVIWCQAWTWWCKGSLACPVEVSFHLRPNWRDWGLCLQRRGSYLQRARPRMYSERSTGYAFRHLFLSPLTQLSFKGFRKPMGIGVTEMNRGQFSPSGSQECL